MIIEIKHYLEFHATDTDANGDKLIIEIFSGDKLELDDLFACQMEKPTVVAKGSSEVTEDVAAL